MYVSEVNMYLSMYAYIQSFIYSQMLQSSLLIHSNHPTQFVLVLDCCYTVEVMENLPLQYSGLVVEEKQMTLLNYSSSCIWYQPVYQALGYTHVKEATMLVT